MWSYIKSLIPSDEISEKEITLVVNGLVNRLSPENQSELVFQLLQHREKEIQKTLQYLQQIQNDKTNLKNRVDELHFSDLLLNVG